MVSKSFVRVQVAQLFLLLRTLLIQSICLKMLLLPFSAALISEVCITSEQVKCSLT